MITRDIVMRETQKVLEESGFQYSFYDGCFDIAARKKDTFLIKVLLNIDSFQEDQSANLRVLSNKIEATAVLVGAQTRYEKLNNGIIYERFNIPALTPGTLEKILFNKSFPEHYRFRGGLFSEIDAEKLRSARTKKNMSQSELAKKAGVSKKNIYEHEAATKMAHLDVVNNLEKILGEKISNPMKFSAELKEEIVIPSGDFEKMIGKKLSSVGFDIDYIQKTPFNIIASQKETILLEADTNEKNLQKKAPQISQFSKLIRKSAFIVTEKEASFDIPTIGISEIKSMKSTKEMERLARKRK